VSLLSLDVREANKPHRATVSLQTGRLSFSYSNFSAAYKHADGKKIDGRRVLVDVERARTVNGWLPRRLGKLILL